MQALEQRDWFTDRDISKDPYPFLEAVRAHGPVYQPPGRDYLIVTGCQEAIEVLNNAQDFSSAIALVGASASLPFEPDGSDISKQLDANRPNILGGDLLVNLDDTPHTNMRALVNRLFTPSRLKANEAFMAELADEMVRRVVANGQCEMMSEIATPFVTLVIADLLGVPPEDRQGFMDVFAASPCAGSLGGADDNVPSDEDSPMIKLGEYFARYHIERQANPRPDILSELAHAEYPDGSKPRMQDIVTLGTLMFGAGQDTSAKLLGNAMRFIIEVPGLQEQVRADPSLVPAVIEESLRLEGSAKQTARLARRNTRIGDWPVAAGTKVLVMLAGGNRDPLRWENPEPFELKRPRIKENLAFGRGKHVCPGAPLVRVEVRLILEKFIELTSHIDLDEAKHGPHGNRSFEFEPSFIIRGLTKLQLKLTAGPAPLL